MARIDWVLAAETAFLDSHARLCMVGITTRLIVPSLPVGIRQPMVVAHIVDQRAGEELEVGAAVLTPAGTWATPDDPDCVHIEVAAEFVLVTLRDLPVREEGTHRFAVYLDQAHPVAVEVPVYLMPTERRAQVH